MCSHTQEVLHAHTLTLLLTYAGESYDDPEDAADDVLVQEEDDGRVDDGDGEADGQHDGEDHPRQHHEPVTLEQATTHPSLTNKVGVWRNTLTAQSQRSLRN